MNRISFKESGISLDIEFLDNPAADKIKAALPIMSEVNTWGDEIYFDAGIDAPSAGATMDVEVGDVAYWPEGRSLCVFFGKTPVSSDDRPRPASEVVVVGRAQVDPVRLREVPPGSEVVVA